MYTSIILDAFLNLLQWSIKHTNTLIDRIHKLHIRYLMNENSIVTQIKHK